MRDADGPPRIAGLTVLRFVAVVLITNSHLDTLYPIALLGTGGALGNALFFGLSGYGLAIGRSRFLPYGSWLMRRAARIYPSVTIVSVVLLAFFGIPEIRSVWDVLGTFLYPTRWWFLGALLAFYLPAYWLIRSGSWRAVAIAGLLAV